MRCGNFTAPGYFTHDALFVGRQRKGFADTRIVERFLRHVEANEIGAEIIECMEIRTLEQNVEKVRWNQLRVPNDIGLSRFVKI